MKDEINIRELYNKIIEERAMANGVILMENVKIPKKNSSLDLLNFDGKTFDYYSGYAFSFIGENGTIYYTDDTHPYIFNVLSKIRSNPTDIKRMLKDYSVKICGNYNKNDLEYFYDKQKAQSNGDTRRNTFSGRIWKNIQSQSAGKNVSVIAFWCREKQINEDILKRLKKCFTDKDIFWIASDSGSFHYYGDTFKDTPSGEIKELKSKIHPELTHDQIVDILMRAHTGFRMTPFEQKVVWEFRGFDPSEIKHITGGYPSVAEYEYRKKLSEKCEKI
jgi:hypothetical protein